MIAIRPRYIKIVPANLGILLLSNHFTAGSKMEAMITDVKTANTMLFKLISTMAQPMTSRVFMTEEVLKDM